MPANNDVTVTDLLALIGRQVIYDAQQCEIVELLDDCQFVLQVLNKGSHIQATQYGQGHRSVPITYIIPVFDSEGALHAEFIAAGLNLLLAGE